MNLVAGPTAGTGSLPRRVFNARRRGLALNVTCWAKPYTIPRRSPPDDVGYCPADPTPRGGTV